MHHKSNLIIKKIFEKKNWRFDRTITHDRVYSNFGRNAALHKKIYLKNCVIIEWINKIHHEWPNERENTLKPTSKHGNKQDYGGFLRNLFCHSGHTGFYFIHFIIIHFLMCRATKTIFFLRFEHSPMTTDVP